MSLFQVNDKGVVRVHGHLDRETLSKNWWSTLSTSEKSMLERQGKCTFDLAEVERVDSAGLAWLINAIRDGRQNNVEVKLTDAPEKLIKLAKISDVDTLLPVE